jgi:hypothetical protein
VDENRLVFDSSIGKLNYMEIEFRYLQPCIPCFVLSLTSFKLIQGSPLSPLYMCEFHLNFREFPAEVPTLLAYK